MSQLPNRISQESHPRTSACFSTNEVKKCTYLHGSNGDAEIENRYLDTVGERKGGMIWESGTETCVRECMLSPFGHVHLFVTQWTACQTPHPFQMGTFSPGLRCSHFYLLPLCRSWINSLAESSTNMFTKSAVLIRSRALPFSSSSKRIIKTSSYWIISNLPFYSYILSG